MSFFPQPRFSRCSVTTSYQHSFAFALSPRSRTAYHSSAYHLSLSFAYLHSRLIIFTSPYFFPFHPVKTHHKLHCSEITVSLTRAPKLTVLFTASPPPRTVTLTSVTRNKDLQSSKSCLACTPRSVVPSGTGTLGRVMMQEAEELDAQPASHRLVSSSLPPPNPPPPASCRAGKISRLHSVGESRPGQQQKEEE